MTVRLTDRVYSALVNAGIPSALIGAAALATHGVSRSTVDEDLLVVDRRALLAEIWKPIVPQAIVDVRHGDDDDPLLGVVRVSAPGERDVDVVVGRHGWQAEIVDRAVAPASGAIPVVAAADLVLLKLYAGGPQDLWDIEQLRGATPDLDAAVEARVDLLPQAARDAWRRLTA